MFFKKTALALIGALVIAALGTTAVVAETSEDQTPWTQVGSDITGVLAWEELGDAVALNDQGTIMAVGSAAAQPGGLTARGEVVVYELRGGTWDVLGQAIPGVGANSGFGQSVALSPDGLVVVIGSSGNHDGAIFGAVHVYDYTNAQWVLRGSSIPALELFDGTGSAVALSADGNRVVIGSYLSKFGGFGSGQVRVFDWDGTTWGQAGATLSGEASDQFGRSIAISGDGLKIAAGGPGHNSSTGIVRLYSFSGGAWVPLGQPLTGPGESSFFGTSVSLDEAGQSVAIGAPSTTAGSVHVFDLVLSTWEPRGATLVGDTTGDEFGYAVALDSSGTRLAIGAPRSNDNAGSVRVFHYPQTSWEPLGTVILGSRAEDNLGTEVAISGTGYRIAVGAPGYDTPLANNGLVRVFGYPQAPTDNTAALSGAGLAGIHLHVAGPVGRLAADSPVYFGSDAVAARSSLELTLRKIGSTTGETLIRTVASSAGHYTGRITLPALTSGDYTITLLGTHKSGTGLRLVAPLKVGFRGEFVVLGSNLPGIW